MRELNPNLIRSVAAQADAIAQPTFATDVDFSTPGGGVTPPPGENDGGNNEATTGEITLVAPQQLCSEDDTFQIEVKIDTLDNPIGSYTVQINFDQAVVQVVDTDTELSGIQIETSGDFNVTTNTASNSTGIITLSAEIEDPVAVEEIVGKITFKAISQGNSKIEISEDNSSLVDETSADILDKTTSVTVTINDNCIETGNTPPPITPPPTPGQGVGELPKSDLPFSGALYLLFGVVLVYAGVVGRRIAKQQRHR
jgi:hypothetical protein